MSLPPGEMYHLWVDSIRWKLLKWWLPFSSFPRTEADLHMHKIHDHTPTISNAFFVVSIDLPAQKRSIVDYLHLVHSARGWSSQLGAKFAHASIPCIEIKQQRSTSTHCEEKICTSTKNSKQLQFKQTSGKAGKKTNEDKWGSETCYIMLQYIQSYNC